MSAKDYYIGIDIGSTHVKAGVYSGSGELEAIANASTPVHRTDNGGSYYLANEIWETVLTCMRSCVARVQGKDIKAIGISSMAESGVIMNERDEAIGPVLTWYDQRPRPQVDIIKQAIPTLELYRRTGLALHPKFPLAKFLWIRENMPDIWSKGHSWLHMAEYIAFCLTGKKRTEISLASRTMLFDIEKNAWDDDLIQTFGIKRGLLQPLIQAGQMVGKVSKEASRLALISDGIPVTIAGHDHVVGAYGIGGIQIGDVTNSCGTAETLVLTMPESNTENMDHVPNYMTGRHVVSDRFYAILPVGATGGMVESFLSMNGWNYEHLLSALSKKHAPNNPLGFFPSPPGNVKTENDVHIAWLRGGALENDTVQMAIALIQGVSCLFRHQLEVLQALNMKMNRLMVIGGATKNPFWMQAKADILNQPLHIIHNSEAVTGGAALLAAQINGAKIKIPPPDSYTINPNQENARKLNTYYHDVYKKNVHLIKDMAI